MGRPSNVGKEVEEPKKPDSVLKEEMENNILLKMGYDPATTTSAQRSDAMYKATMMVAKQSKPVPVIERFKKIKELKERDKKEKLEYEQKLWQYRMTTSPFKCTLNEAQMELLLTFFNEHLLEEPISLEELEDIFMGKDRGLTYLLRLKDWKLFILLFKGLSGDTRFKSDKTKNVESFFSPIQEHHYICSSWQKAIEDLEVFLNENGDNLTAQRIARQLNKIGDGERRMPSKIDILQQLFEQLVTLE